MASGSYILLWKPLQLSMAYGCISVAKKCQNRKGSDHLSKLSVDAAAVLVGGDV